MMDFNFIQRKIGENTLIRSVFVRKKMRSFRWRLETTLFHIARLRFFPGHFGGSSVSVTRIRDASNSRG